MTIDTTPVAVRAAFGMWILAVSRAVHIAAVWAGVALMFVPSAHRYFQRGVRPAVA
jgi:hypothetical protein